MFIAFVAFAVFGLRKPGDRAIESQIVGQVVPAIDLPGLDAAHPGLTSPSLAAGKPKLINVFASWCIPCRVEAPQLEALAAKGVIIHAIAVRDKPGDVKAFLAEHGDPFKAIGMDTRSRAMIALGASGVPETFLVDGEGIVRKQYIGEIRPEQVGQILADIEEAS